MKHETKTTLPQGTIEKLQELIQLNIDSRDGLNEAAEHVDNDLIATVLREMAVRRNDRVSELRTLVAANHEEPGHAGSLLATAHRAWMNLRAVLGGSVDAILGEVELGEDFLKAKYEDLLLETSGSAVTDVLNRQYTEVKESHARVRAMRDNLGD